MNQDIYVLVEHLRGQVSDITCIMLAAARSLVQEAGGQVVGILLGHNVQGLSQTLNADRVLYLDHQVLAEFTSDAYCRTLGQLLVEHSPRAFLLGHTTIGMDVASLLSAHLGLPLVSQCQTIRSENSNIKFTCQMCGGKIMAEGSLPQPTALVTFVSGGYKSEAGLSDNPPQVTQLPVPVLENLHVILKGYIEPASGDVDITKEPILVSVGRGIQTQDNLELAESLAEQLGGVLSGSRPVVDQGWLPTTRLIGKSGKRVAPKLYLALGISGAPEHVEGIAEGGMIVAINMDPSAPIFNTAKYGAAVDLFDLVPVLTEKLQQAKSV